MATPRFDVTAGSALDKDATPAREVVRTLFMAAYRMKFEELRTVVGTTRAELDAMAYAGTLVREAFPQWWSSWRAVLDGP